MTAGLTTVPNSEIAALAQAGDEPVEPRTRGSSPSGHPSIPYMSSWTEALATSLRSNTVQTAVDALARAIRLHIATDMLEVSFIASDDTLLGSCISTSASAKSSDDAHLTSQATASGEACSQVPETILILQLTSTCGVTTRIVAHSLTASFSMLPSSMVELQPLLALASERLWRLQVAAYDSTTLRARTQTFRPNYELPDRIGTSLLSPRERQVLDALLSGRAPKCIAHDLAISPGTVRNHMRHIYAKLKVSSRSELQSRIFRAALDSRETAPSAAAPTLHAESTVSVDAFTHNSAECHQ